MDRHICSIYVFVVFVIFVIRVYGGREPEVSCPSIDVRNSPKELEVLRNCTVIKGSLMIVLIQKVTKDSFDGYAFPKLREITDFFLLYDVAGLKRLDKLFPNLTVIRGRRLFLNYALSIYAMKDLETVGLKSLIAIQRGHVFIDRCPKLCYLNKVDWNRLTLSPGVNHIKSDVNTDYTCDDSCRSCRNCWSNFYCQKFHNDNLVHLLKKSQCHPLCLGGCYNGTIDGCLLCQNFSTNGKCVEECPKDRYSSKDHLRCYTAGECADLGFYIHKNECVPFCPSGYEYKENENAITKECERCSDDCPRTCNGSNILNLADSEYFRGCKIVNGSIVMRIPEEVKEDELKDNLREIKEISGFLKIYETPSMTSMDIFRDLVKIDANPREYEHFGLLIYGNKKLQRLWDWSQKKTLDLNQSSIFMHSNYALCNTEIEKIVQVANHTKDFDEIQYNDQEVLCNPNTLDVTVQSISHNTATLEWEMSNTATEVKISYADASESNGTVQFDQDKDHCKKNLWITEYLLKEDLSTNQNSVSYTITSLKQNTQYVFFVEIFSGNDEDSAQSKHIFFKTKSIIPSSPFVYTQNKSTDFIELAWFPASYNDDNENQVITFYKVDIFAHPEKQEVLDRRNYCTEPFQTVDILAELLDYDNCCNVVEFERDEFDFISLMDQNFRCSTDDPNNCDMIPSGIKNDTEIYKPSHYVRSINNISGNASSVVIDKLKHFTVYAFQFFACNDLGCGPYFLHTDRTAPDNDADKIENFTVSVNKTSPGAQYKFSVKVVPPKDPNGAILLYNIYFRRRAEFNYIGDIKCLSRQEFEQMNYEFVKVFPHNDYNVSVRIQSVAGPGKATEWVVLYKVSWNWLTWLFLLLFSGLIGGIYFTVRRRIRISNLRSTLIPRSTRTLSCSQNEDDDEDILMERMQAMHVDEYSPLDVDEHEL